MRCRMIHTALLFLLLFIRTGVPAAGQDFETYSGRDRPDAKSITVPFSVSEQIRRSPVQGLRSLADYLESPGDDYVTVKRYHDWLSLYVLLDPSVRFRPGTPVHFILRERRGGPEAFARVFKALLDAAGIRNVLVSGINKLYAGPGGDPVPWMWNAVRIGNRWQLVNTAMDAVPSYRDRPENPETEYSGEYLFISPEVHLLTHYPEDDRYLLTGTDVTEEEFLSRPLYSEGYHRFEIAVAPVTAGTVLQPGRILEPLPWDGIFQASDRYELQDGRLDWRVKKPDNLEISALLFDRYGTRRDSRVLVYEDNRDSRIEIAAAEPGEYTASVYARTDTGGAPWSEIYRFSLGTETAREAAFPEGGRLYLRHPFQQYGLGLAAAAVPAPTLNPARCYLRISLPEGYEVSGFLEDEAAGENLPARIQRSYTGFNEVEFRFYPPRAGRYRGGITLIGGEGLSRPVTAAEFYLDTWTEFESGIDPSGEEREDSSLQDGTELFLSRDFHGENLFLEESGHTEYGAISMRIGTPDGFFRNGKLLVCDALDMTGGPVEFAAVYNRHAGGYEFLFAPAADSAIKGRIILEEREPETGLFLSRKIIAEVSIPPGGTAPVLLPSSGRLLRQNGSYLGDIRVESENITNEFIEGFLQLAVYHPRDTEFFLQYRDREGTEYTRSSVAVSRPNDRERIFRFKHPRFEPGVVRIMVRNSGTGGEFLPAYEFAVLPGLRSADSMPPAGSLHFYPAFSESGFIFEEAELNTPAGGGYRVEIRVPERYGLTADVSDSLGRPVTGAVRLRVREDVYAFTFTPPPAGREHTVHLYRVDAYGSKVPVCMFRLD